MTCQYASSGCNDPEGECLGLCMQAAQQPVFDARLKHVMALARVYRTAPRELRESAYKELQDAVCSLLSTSGQAGTVNPLDFFNTVANGAKLADGWYDFKTSLQHLDGKFVGMAKPVLTWRSPVTDFAAQLVNLGRVKP